MQTDLALATINSLAFLANPINTEKKVVTTVNAFSASFSRIGDKVAVSYPFAYDSYQAGKVVLIWTKFILDDFYTSTEGNWSVKYDKETQSTSLLRHPFLFERKVVEHKAQLTVEPLANHKYRKKIEELVLDYGLITHSCRCSLCKKNQNGSSINHSEPPNLKALPQTALFAAVDVCTATHKVTGKTHLLVLSPTTDGKFTIYSFCKKT